jgi:hypothetical protein
MSAHDSVLANVSLWKGLVKLFIKLQDKGYPGSMYTL